MYWVHLVRFAKQGRVAQEWEINTLHDDMKWSVGWGIRSIANNITRKANLGISEEDAIVQLFIGQPFRPEGGIYKVHAYTDT